MEQVRVSSWISKFENCAVPREAYIPLGIMVKNRRKRFFDLYALLFK